MSDSPFDQDRDVNSINIRNERPLTNALTSRPPIGSKTSYPSVYDDIARASRSPTRSGDPRGRFGRCQIRLVNDNER